MRDNPDSFYNGALSSDILHALEKLNGKVTDKDVGNFTPNIRKTYNTPKHFGVPNPTPRGWGYLVVTSK